MMEAGPGAADIVHCGLYRGMAASSVLEPIVLLYRRTGDAQLLRFAEWIVSRWSAPDGPQLDRKGVHRGSRRRAVSAPPELVFLGKRREGLRDDVVLRRPVGTVSRNRPHGLSRCGHAHAREHSLHRDQRRRVGLLRGVLVRRHGAPDTTGEESHGNVRHGDLDALWRESAAPHRRRALRRCDRDRRLQCARRSHLAGRIALRANTARSMASARSARNNAAWS